MRELTKREKSLLGLVVATVVVVLLIKMGPAIGGVGLGGTLALKREQLQAAQDLVALAQITKQIDDKLRVQVGLQGDVISESLVQEIAKERDALENLNRARRASDLANLHPALEAKAGTVLAYKKGHGKFESLDALKSIQGPIFEGEPAEAVIRKRISDLAKKAGLKPQQLSVKALSGKKSEKLPIQAKQNLILYLYLNELETELKQLEKQREESEQKLAEAEQEVMNAIYDAWWSDDDVSDTHSDEKKNAEVEKESNEQLVKGKLGATGEESEIESKKTSTPHVSEKLADDSRTHVDSHRQFARVPEVIPSSLRIELIQFIQSNIKLQMEKVADFKKGFIEDQIKVAEIPSKGGFLGIGSKAAETQVSLKEGGILLAKFEELINRYEDEMAYDSDGETEDALNYGQQLKALGKYISQIVDQKKKLRGWFAKVPSTHKPEIYIVEMNFKGDVEKVVKLIQSIESSTKWLFVRNLRMAADQKNRNKPTLGITLSMVAKVL